MKASKLLWPIGIGVLVAATLAVMSAIFMHWRLDRPSSAERRLARVLAERPRVPDTDNAYIYLWGFQAAMDVDPARAGAERLAWLAEFNLGGRSAPDPLADGLDFEQLQSAQLDDVLAACKVDKQIGCRTAFEALGPVPAWSRCDLLLLARYERLLRHSGYYATVRSELHSPVPPWVAILAAQRRYFIRMRDFARTADVATIRAQLEADLSFWRMAQESADDLIAKMIAVAAIRQHFFLGCLVLRALPPAHVGDALPDAWRRPMSAPERSMWRVYAGELEFTRSVVREMEHPIGEPSVLSEAGSPAAEVLEKISSGIFPPRMMVRTMARQYADVAQAFEVPLENYLTAQETLGKKPRLVASSMAYPVRVAAVETWRRAAMLAAQLRADAVPAPAIPARVAGTGLRDPLTGKAFEWDPLERAVVATQARTKSNPRLYFFH